MPLDVVKEGARKAQSAAVDRAVAFGRKAAELAGGGAQRVSEKAREVATDVQLAIYKPVMREVFESGDFDIPKMIVIVDEDQRKGIEICAGAVGWMSKKANMEVLHLYEEAVASSGLKFYPLATCDEVYRQDPFDATLYVSLAEYLDVMQQNRITEIKDIARKLGATYCKVELCEEEKKSVAAGGKASAGAKLKGEVKADDLSVSGGADADLGASSSSVREILIEQEYDGSDNPQEPELKWFKLCEEIQSLIRSRCEGANSTKTYIKTVECSSSSAMSLKLARKIDVALGLLGASGDCTFQTQISAEHHRYMRIEMRF